MRRELGESLASVEKYDAPIDQATTASLEALQVFDLAELTREKSGGAAAIPIIKRALELDPDFAMAHARLGTYYSNLGESLLAMEHRRRAYELRERVTSPNPR